MLSREVIQSIVDSTHGQPFQVLGPHREEVAAGHVWSVRAFQPEAKRLWVVDLARAGLAVEAKRLHEHGFFAAPLPDGDSPPRYRLRLDSGAGAPREIDDPYSFDPVLGEFDLHLLGEGTHYRSWEKLGSHVTTQRGTAGVSFAVWAPNARRVSVVGNFNGWDGLSISEGRRRPSPMTRSPGPTSPAGPGASSGPTCSSGCGARTCSCAAAAGASCDSWPWSPPLR